MTPPSFTPKSTSLKAGLHASRRHDANMTRTDADDAEAGHA
jgi:hypothetical protein